MTAPHAVLKKFPPPGLFGFPSRLAASIMPAVAVGPEG
jgi:hypothetical protein